MTLAMTIAATVCMATIWCDPAQAMPSGDPAGVRKTSELIDPILKAGCWRDGWRGWGWYRHCGPRPLHAWEPGCREVTIREYHWGESEVRHIRRCD
jgi:hypothetical protein